MDDAARNKTLLANKGLACRVAWQLYQSRPLVRRLGELADVDQEALLGLLAAIKHFDPARGFQFSTYATAVVRHHVLTAAYEQALVAVPEGSVSIYSRPQATAKKCRTATRMAAALRGTHALPVRFDRAGPSPRTAGPDLGAALARLCRADRSLLERRFGLTGDGPHAIQLLAAEEGCTRQAVQRRATRALGRLRKYMRGAAAQEVA